MLLEKYAIYRLYEIIKVADLRLTLNTHSTNKNTENVIKADALPQTFKTCR